MGLPQICIDSGSGPGMTGGVRLPPSQQEYQLGGQAYEIRNDKNEVFIFIDSGSSPE